VHCHAGGQAGSDVSTPPAVIEGLRRFEQLVHACADRLDLPRPAITVGKSQDCPNASAVGVGTGRMGIKVNPQLAAAGELTQLWFAAHEVGHLRFGVDQPVVALLTGRTALTSMWAVCVAGMAGGVLAVDGQPGKSLTFLAVFALMMALTAAWFACSRREELAADQRAVDALAGLGYDPVAVAAHTLLAPRHGPKTLTAADYLVGTHPAASTRLQAVQQRASGGVVRAVTAVRGKPLGWQRWLLGRWVSVRSRRGAVVRWARV